MTKLLTTLIIFGNVFCMVVCSKIQDHSDSLEKRASGINHERNGEKNGWGWPAPPVAPPLQSCISPSKIVVADNINFTFYQTDRLYYISAKTDNGHRKVAQAFLGRPATDAELDTMCFTKFYGSVFYKPGPFINSGFGLQFRETCGPVDMNPAITKCVPDLDQNFYDRDSNVKPPISKILYLLKTDSKTYSISYICVDGVADFQMRTMNGFVTPEHKRILKQTIGKYGLDIKYLPCLVSPHQHPYPHPFQNYPNP